MWINKIQEGTVKKAAIANIMHVKYYFLSQITHLNKSSAHCHFLTHALVQEFKSN